VCIQKKASLSPPSYSLDHGTLVNLKRKEYEKNAANCGQYMRNLKWTFENQSNMLTIMNGSVIKNETCS